MTACDPPTTDADAYPPIAEYAFLGDGHSAALVGPAASIDWLCMPRIDSPSVFGRLLDWERGGHCAVTVGDPVDPVDPGDPAGGAEDAPRTVRRRYLDETMVLETTLRSGGAEVIVTDALAVGPAGSRRQLIRSLVCSDGPAEVAMTVALRFDYGTLRPWLRDARDDDHRTFTALGGSEGMLIWSDLDLAICDDHDLRGTIRLAPGERRWLSLEFCEPELIDDAVSIDHEEDQLATRLGETVDWWRAWVQARRGTGPLPDDVVRSALVLKALVHAPTGAIAAAATTSLPEELGGARNWDYRFSWVRDSWFTVRTLGDIGFVDEADRFRRFIERSAAGNPEDLQLLYAVDGAHRTPEVELPLHGYRGSRPVRVGNEAGRQYQLDTFGHLLELAWEWCERGEAPDEPYWRFIAGVADRVCVEWERPDHGIWEVRCAPQQFVYSKASCWVALERAVRMAEGPIGLDGAATGDGDGAPAVDVDRWRRNRDQIRALVHSRGVHPEWGCYVQTLDGREVDASLLLLAQVGFVDHDDPHMVATVDRIIAELDDGGLIRRYRSDDGLSGREGTFLACTFWLAESLAALGRREEAEAYFARACSTAGELGLFAEEFDPATGMALGNYPQALSHLAHIGAAIALDGFSESAGAGAGR